METKETDIIDELNGINGLCASELMAADILPRVPANKKIIFTHLKHIAEIDIDEKTRILTGTLDVYGTWSNGCPSSGETKGWIIQKVMKNGIDITDCVDLSMVSDYVEENC